MSTFISTTAQAPKVGSASKQAQALKSRTVRILRPVLSNANQMPPTPIHLISKIGDPIFALFIGLSAAAMRINREEKEQGRSMKESIDAGFRRLGFPRQGDEVIRKG